MTRKSTSVVLGIAAFLFLAALVSLMGRKQPTAQIASPTIAFLGAARTATQVSIQAQTAFLIAPDGSLWWWGDSLPGFGVNQLTPKQIDDGRDWVRVSAGSRFGVALKADGSLWNIGELPAFSMGLSRRIRECMPGTKWRQITASQMHVIALQEDGSLWAWGDNDGGELGDGTTRRSSTAVQAGTDTNWTSVAAGPLTSLAIKSDGSLWHWGCISLMATGPNTYTPVPQTTPIQLGTNTDWREIRSESGSVIGLKGDGSLWLIPTPLSAVGTAKSVHPLGTSGDWVMQCGGWPTGWGIKRDGTLWFWDGTGKGVGAGVPQQFERRSDWKGIWAVHSFGQTRVGLTADGQLWTWGHTLGAQPQPATGPSVLIQQLIARVRGIRLGQPMNYASTQEPWVIMRFETNAAAVSPNGK